MIAVAGSLAALGLAGCSSGRGGGAAPPSTSRLAARLEAREHLGAATAACMARSASRAYDDRELVLIYEQGIGALPSTRGSPYVQAFARCGLVGAGAR